jgi:hypothetical protein
MSAPDNDIEWPWEAEDDDLPEMPTQAHGARDVEQLVPVAMQPPVEDSTHAEWEDDGLSSDDEDHPQPLPIQQWEGLEIEPPPPTFPRGPSPGLSGASEPPPLPAWARDPSEGPGGPPAGLPWDSDDDDEDPWDDENDDDLDGPPPWAAGAAPSPVAKSGQDDIQLDPDCSPEKLQELASHPSQYVRVQVASHPNLPVELMAQFAKDSSHMVRWALWERSDVPPATLQCVDLDDLPADEAYMIAASPACSYEQVMSWYHDHPDDNTLAVLSTMHRHAPDEWVQQVLDNLPESVRVQLARSSSNERLQRVLFNDPELARFLADNPNCASDLLDEFAKSADGQIKDLVVQHQRAPVTALTLLIQDPDRRIANKAARHPNLPEEYRQLAKLV